MRGGGFLLIAGSFPVRQVGTPNRDCTRRQSALPSSRVTPVNACPAQRPRWCPRILAILASQDCCLPAHRRRRLSSTLGWTYPHDHNHYLFRGSITQPAPLFSPAPDSPYGVCLWASLLACRLSFGQVGLYRTIRNHPLGNTIEFHPGFPGIPTTRISLGTTIY